MYQLLQTAPGVLTTHVDELLQASNLLQVFWPLQVYQLSSAQAAPGVPDDPGIFSDKTVPVPFNSEPAGPCVPAVSCYLAATGGVDWCQLLQMYQTPTLVVAVAPEVSAIADEAPVADPLVELMKHFVADPANLDLLQVTK